MDHKELLAAALRQRPVDLLIHDARLVNVHSGEIHDASIGVVGDGIAIVGDAEGARGPETQVINARGRFAVPGFVDAHIHTYESHLPVSALVAPMLEHGVTTIATDFYGEAVVAGRNAVRASLDEAKTLPWNVLYVLPMPAHYQDAPFVHSGVPTPDDMLDMLEWDECVGINECFAPMVAAQNPFLLEVMQRARAAGKALCGHASETTGRRLMAWTAFGGYLDDHECVDPHEVQEKARLGVRIVLREGSAARDVRNGLRSVTELGVSPRAIAFCSDLLSPVDLVAEGNIDRCVRYAIEAGINPVEAVRMGTLNGAESLGVHRWMGSVAPGKRADVALLEGPLEAVRVSTVVSGGRLLVDDGRYLGERAPDVSRPQAQDTVRLPAHLNERSFQLVTDAVGRARVRSIGVRDGSIITSERHVDVPVADGCLVPDPDNDIAKAAAIERHGVTGNIGLGFVQGFGLRRGALASTYNPHNQHLLVIGQDDRDMLLAAQTVAQMAGGFAVVDGGQVLARVPLPLFGLLSDQPAGVLVDQINGALAAARGLGCHLKAPFHTLAFLGLAVIIGTLKLSSVGLVDVWAARRVPVELSAGAAKEQ